MALRGVLVVAASVGTISASLAPFVPGCCVELNFEDIYVSKTGLTLGECAALCMTDRPRCASMEHSPWMQGLCTLFRRPATGVGCQVAEKTCWSERFATHGVDTAHRHSLDDMRRWHAKELFDLLRCSYHSSFQHFLEEGRNVQFDHHSAWLRLVNDGHYGFSPLGNNTEYFGEENEAYFAKLMMLKSHLLNIIRGDVEVKDLGENEFEYRQCTYGLLFVIYLCVLRFREEKSDLVHPASWGLRMLYWLRIGGPESDSDLLHSSGWPATTWDIVVATLDEDRAAEDYASYIALRPSPPPLLTSPLDDMPAMLSTPPSSRPLRASMCGGHRKVSLAMIGMVRQMQQHQLSALKTAYEGVCGADHAVPTLEAIFAYTGAGPMSDYDLGSVQQMDLDWESITQHWHGMDVRFLPDPGRIATLASLDEVQQDLAGLLLGDGPLSHVDLLVCGEPVYVCTAAAGALDTVGDRRPMLAHLGMALLHQPKLDTTVLESREAVVKFMMQFLALLVRPRTFMSAANRITIEQVFWQVGVRLPIAHFAGIHITPSAKRESDTRALLFRTKFPAIVHYFLRILKLFAIREGSQVDLVDMNHYASLSWAEIGSFNAVVLLPHNVHLIRTADLYAMEVMLFVPSAPFLFQFIYPGSNLYGGHGAPHVLRLGLDRRAQAFAHKALGLRGSGYRLGVAPTTPREGELIPRSEFRNCPFRIPSVGTCYSKRDDGVTVPRPCPWGLFDLDEQEPVSCTEAAAAGADSAQTLGNVTCEETRDDDIEEADGPEYDPFDHLYGDFSPWCGIDAYRYWYGYTEYSLLHGLQRFGSAAELLAGLESMLLGDGAQDRREAVRATMRAHQRVRTAETVQWWSQALLATMRG